MEGHVHEYKKQKLEDLFFQPHIPAATAPKIYSMFWYMTHGKLKVKVIWEDRQERELDWFSESRKILNLQQQMVEQV